jgi:DNA-binding response OmpR family regulator
VEEIRPDVVIVDLQVRNMGGMAVVRDIRATVAPEKMPRLVILLDRTVDGFLAKRAGADAWVVKPFTDHDLRTALADIASPTG